MAEVYVSMRENGERGLKKAGDILVARPDGYNGWGTMQRSAVIKWDDIELDNQLANLAASGREAVVVLPYAEYEEKELSDGVTIPELVNRSSVVVHVESLDESTRDKMDSRDPNSVAATLSDSDLPLRNRKKDSKGGTAIAPNLTRDVGGTKLEPDESGRTKFKERSGQHRSRPN